MTNVRKALAGAVAAAALALAVPGAAHATAGVYYGPDSYDQSYYGPNYQPPIAGAPAYGYDDRSAPDGYYSDESDGGYGDDAYAGDFYGNDGYADAGACDSYAPPWGAPPDYCDYALWDQPVYFGGGWYSGPIYYRAIGGVDWFWLNGGWHRDEWRGARPAHIDWNNGRNHVWHGPVRRGGSFAGGNRGFAFSHAQSSVGAGAFAFSRGGQFTRGNFPHPNPPQGGVNRTHFNFGNGGGVQHTGPQHLGNMHGFTGGVSHGWSGGAAGGSFSHNMGNNNPGAHGPGARGHR